MATTSLNNVKNAMTNNICIFLTQLFPQELLSIINNVIVFNIVQQF